LVISVGTVYSLITSSSEEEITGIEDLLTIKMPNYWFSPNFRNGLWDGTKSYLRQDRGSGLHYFLTGFIPLLLAHFPDTVIHNKRSKSLSNLSTPYLLKTKTMTGEYDYQFQAVKAVLQNKRGILHLGTGAGKTAIAAALSTLLPPKILFIVPKIDLMWQTLDTFKEETDLQVSCLGGGQELDDTSDVCIAVIKSAKLRCDNDKKWPTQFKAVFVDECHRGSSDEYVSVITRCTNAEYRIGMSGTPLNMDEDRNMQLVGLLGPVIEKISGYTLASLGVNATPKITLHDFYPSLIDNMWPECYIAGVVENLERNKLIVNIAQEALEKQKTCLVLVSRQEHGTILQEIFKTQGLQVPYLDGRSAKLTRRTTIASFRQGEIPLLILSKIGEEGLDIPQLDVVIRASAGLSPISTIQALGRGLRRKKEKENIIEYHDFVDNDGGILAKHSARRIQDYIEEGYTVEYVSGGIDKRI
jgi:superfamily II DNA or RNA helicase